MKILLITNILTPYRIYFFNKLFEKLNEKNAYFKVFVMTHNEDNRNWYYEDLKRPYTKLLDSKTYRVLGLRVHYNNNIKDEIKKYMPDIVICAGNYFSPSVHAAINLKSKLNYKLYFWSESHLDEKKSLSYSKKLLREWIRKYTYPKFDGFLYSGEKSSAFIKKYNNNPGKMIYVPNIVDCDLYSKACDYSAEKKQILLEKYGLDNNRMKMFCPARLCEEKGIIPFLNIISSMPEKDMFEIIFAGDGEDKEKIESLILKYNLNVHLLGYRQPEEIVELYSVSDVFLMPSLSDPNPLTCIEALWAGLPLLLSEHVGNHPEVLSDSVNGYLFSYSDEKKIRSIIKMLIDNDSKWYENAKFVSKQLAQNYKVNNVVDNMISEINV